MPRLLLINPAIAHKASGNVRATTWPPLSLPYLAAVTPSHYQIEVLDENIEPFEMRQADIVGITSFSASINRAYEISQKYQKRGIPTVMGGIHVSMMPDEAQRFCDSVVTGEAEGVWPTVLRDFEAGKLKRQYEGVWMDLKNLPIPRRDILQNSMYGWSSMQTSRGCPYNCSFCSVSVFNGRRFRRRSLNSVIEELKHIPQKFVMLADDNIIGHGQKDLEWTHAFFSRILEERIKKIFWAQASILFGEDRELIRLAARSGLRLLFIGLESVNSATLQSYRKSINLNIIQQNRTNEMIAGIRKGGIAILGSFVIGGDKDERSVFHSTLEFIKSSRIDVVQITKPTPLPGTQLWEDLRTEGRIIDQNFPAAWEDYRFTKLVFEPAQMSREEVYEGFTYLRKMYYSFWETVKRTLSTLLSTKSLTATLLAYKFNVSYKKAFRTGEHYRRYKATATKERFVSVAFKEVRPSFWANARTYGRKNRDIL